MNTNSAVKIIPALPTCGILLFLVLGFCLNVSPPTMELVNFGFIPFLTGYVVYALVVLLLTLSLGSFAALVRLTTSRTPGIGIYLFVIVWYGVAGLFWGGVGWSSVELAKTHTANEEVTLDGTAASFHHWSTRSKCNGTVVFETNLGELEVCATGSRSRVPKSLQMGEHVRLIGQKNAYAFVLRKVMKDSEGRNVECLQWVASESA